MRAGTSGRREHLEWSWKNILNIFDVTARRQGKDVGQDEDCNEDCKDEVCKSIEDCKDEVLHGQLGEVSLRQINKMK